MQPGTGVPGPYGDRGQYGGQAGPMYVSPNATGVDSRFAPPVSFYRDPSRAVAYTRFERFSIVWDLNDLRRNFQPPLPALLVPCDVTHDDWNRCIADITAAWSGTLLYDIFGEHRRQHQRQPTNTTASTPSSRARALVRPSSAVSKTIDIWNASFFYPRKLEMILFRGLERRSGMTAGRRDERLRRENIPAQYQAALMRRRRVTRDSDEEDDSDTSSLTSSSTSASSGSFKTTSEEELESEEEEEPSYVTRRRDRLAVGSNQMLQTPYPTKSRRNSMAAPATTGVGMDMHEMWAVKSREAIKMIRSRQKLEKKRRKLERRQRRRAQLGEPLYSVWISCTQ